MMSDMMYSSDHDMQLWDTTSTVTTPPMMHVINGFSEYNIPLTFSGWLLAALACSFHVIFLQSTTLALSVMSIGNIVPSLGS